MAVSVKIGTGATCKKQRAAAPAGPPPSFVVQSLARLGALHHAARRHMRLVGALLVRLLGYHALRGERDPQALPEL